MHTFYYPKKAVTKLPLIARAMEWCFVVASVPHCSSSLGVTPTHKCVADIRSIVLVLLYPLAMGSSWCHKVSLSSNTLWGCDQYPKDYQAQQSHNKAIFVGHFDCLATYTVATMWNYLSLRFWYKLLYLEYHYNCTTCGVWLVHTLTGFLVGTVSSLSLDIKENQTYVYESKLIQYTH